MVASSSHKGVILHEKSFPNANSIEQEIEENKNKNEGIPELKVVYMRFHSSCMCLYKRKNMIHDDCGKVKTFVGNN